MPVSHNFSLVTLYLVAVAFVTQLVVLCLQIRSWRRTRHSSLMLLAIATGLGILYLLVENALRAHSTDQELLWEGYLALAGIYTGTAIAGIWGVRSLFSAFEASYLSDKRGQLPIAAQPGPSQTSADTVAVASPPITPRSVPRSMLALIRWLIWRPFDARALDAPDSAIAALALLSIGMVIGLGRIGLGPTAEISLFSAQALACKTLGLLAVGWIMWRLCDPRASWRTVLFILAGLTALAVPARWGIEHLGTSRIIAAWGLLAVQVVYLSRALRLATGTRQLRAVALSLITLIIGTAISAQYLEAGPIWYVPDYQGPGNYMHGEHEAERLLMEQPAHIDAAVAAMAPRAGAHSAYMVGFAGVGEQKVFAGEISLAAKVIGERYGTQQRTLLLVNDQRDLESHPLASVTGLKLALADIGRRMDPERDVLFLAISSHGSDTPSVSVSNGGIQLNDLSGNDLKAALDEAGIRWRVVIISACHAGAFIPYLSNDHTIVVAAAAADRTSFGCSNDRDITDFGEAFIRDAWPTAPSLRAAFEKARADISVRESREHLTPSMPTASFGNELERIVDDKGAFVGSQTGSHRSTPW
jgi:hypothetical protein